PSGCCTTLCRSPRLLIFYLFFSCSHHCLWQRNLGKKTKTGGRWSIQEIFPDVRSLLEEILILPINLAKIYFATENVLDVEILGQEKHGRRGAKNKFGDDRSRGERKKNIFT
ncbi:unnamed protein product, partial [Ectocarpus sp. 6 AP-2014]